MRDAVCSARERVIFFSIAILAAHFSLHSLRACRRSRCSFAPQHTHTHTHTHTHGPRGCTRNGSVPDANHAQFTHRMKRKRKKKTESARRERDRERHQAASAQTEPTRHGSTQHHALTSAHAATLAQWRRCGVVRQRDQRALPQATVCVCARPKPPFVRREQNTPPFCAAVIFRAQKVADSAAPAFWRRVRQHQWRHGAQPPASCGVCFESRGCWRDVACMCAVPWCSAAMRAVCFVVVVVARVDHPWCCLVYSAR